MKAIQSLLDSWGITPLHMLTGQGHHFVWRISRQSTTIPYQEEGTARLLQDYLNSLLRSFHGEFYSCQHDPRESWPRTYGRTPLEALPNFVRHIALFPNDWLLKPAGIQLVTRCLLAEGWNARHIAGFIRSKFEDPAYNWGVDWRDYDPAIRADFYVLLFAGQYATGVDGLVDMNCVSNPSQRFLFPSGQRRMRTGIGP